MFKSLFSLALLISLHSVSAKNMRGFETTHLISTAGAGVGSILMEESSILNPAPLAFFDISSFYVQKMGTKFSVEDSNTSNPYNGPDSDTLAIIASDTKGKAKGSLSYINQKEEYSKRKQISASLSYLIGVKSAMGLAYKYTMETSATRDHTDPEINYQQLTAGFTHIVSKSTSVGLIFIDPLQKRPEETRVVAGFQYNLENFLSLILDIGADYTQDLADTILYKAAVQIKVYNNFFMRAGTFDDKGKAERGNGIGLSWVSPKLMAEIATRNTKILNNEQNTNNKVKETSFSLSYRF